MRDGSISEFDKAKELIDKFNDLAITVVDEILHEVHYGQKFDWIKERSGGSNYTTYWRKVKTEIENICNK